MSIGPTELLVILLVAVVLFGGRLPQVGRSLGLGLRGLREGLRGLGDAPESHESPRPSRDNAGRPRRSAASPESRSDAGVD